MSYPNPLSRETFYLTGIIQENLSISATVYPDVARFGEVLEMLVLNGVVQKPATTGQA